MSTAALPVFAYAALAAYMLYLQRAWIGELYDDGIYFLMSRNVWRFGSPIVDYEGAHHWPLFRSPMVSLMLSPLATFRMSVAVVLERLAIALVGAVWVALSYIWLRGDARLSRFWSVAAACCVATIPYFIVLSTNVMSDMPAAVGVLGGVILLRRGRALPGTLALGLAYTLRTINLVTLVVAPVWFLLRRERRQAVVSAVVGASIAAAWSAVEAAHGTTRYFSNVRQRRLGDPAAGTIGWLDMPSRIASRLHATVSGSMGFLSGIFDISALYTHAHALLVVAALVAVGLAAVGMWRGRLLLEGLVSVATVVAVSMWPWDSTRFLLPLSPFLLGSAAVALTASQSRVGQALAGAGCAVLLAGNLYHFKTVAPAFGPAQMRVAEKRAAYRWIGSNVRSREHVLTFNAIQSFLYSGHPAKIYGPTIPHGTSYAIVDTRGARSYKGRVVFQAPPYLIVRVDATKRP